MTFWDALALGLLGAIIMLTIIVGIEALTP